MKKKADKSNLSVNQTGSKDEENLKGYPSYPEKEDISLLIV